ncbi:DUF2306 domain-containing protein [Actinoplanes utahensis]|uniref:DUF2306 domain-containing protein n=1 Tax=Actinoplanes utahensis TaxID=1869 RepID=A0A0A6UID0_ACTUT|nr:DUF2306 domain-containing protein [Actinoplanes utahensis]KHD75835.1 hypothetical protein MB27_20595 [Actinoplanes utahensis]GIF32240.1 hypothetical protein Aut01nite_52260 [Actinoplanes utahensis]
MPARLRTVLWIMIVVAGLVLVAPYLSLGSRLEVHGYVHYAVLVAHVLTAAVALILGPLQFMPAVRAHRRRHRLIGRVYLLGGVLPAAVTALPVAVWSVSPLTRISLTLAAVLWLVTAGLAVRAARRHDITAHREWMMRNYALTFLAVTARLVVPVILLLRVTIADDSPASIAETATTLIPIGQTAGWIINLAVAEALIRRGTLRRRRPAASGVRK